MGHQERNMLEHAAADFQERLKATRTPFNTEVFLSLGDGQTEIVGELQDLSMFGMYLETDRAVAAGLPCAVRIALSARSSRLVIKDIEASIVRSDRRGLGIQFGTRFEWYVIFKIYTHFSRNGSDLDAASLAEHFGIGNLNQQ